MLFLGDVGLSRPIVREEEIIWTYYDLKGMAKEAIMIYDGINTSYFLILI
jgi:hypothetical protein